MWIRLTIWLSLLVASHARPSPPSQAPSSTLPGTFVPFASFSACPRVCPRKSLPASARDIRPDDFKVVMALGDSISAGLFAKSTREGPLSRPSPPPPSLHVADEQQLPLGSKPILSSLIAIDEYRGVSYPTGNDPGAITIASILSRYSPNLTGVSTGHHPPITCVGPVCQRPERDGLNVAVSGSLSASLLGQVRDYLIPTIEAMDLNREDWKYVNLGIGANDVCDYCFSPNLTEPTNDGALTGTAAEFARGIKDALELLRKHVPHVIVNIIGILKVSSIYDMVVSDPYCSAPLPPILPHLPLECSCALLPGPAGELTRKKMDQLGEAYDEAVLELIREWDEEDDPSFGATWQPGKALNLSNWPIKALSPVDCFHPSEEAHQRVAACFWNRLTLGLEEKEVPIDWEDEVMVRCLEEGDRIPVGVPR